MNKDEIFTKHTGKLLKVHHIGYLIKNVDKAQPAFEALGYQQISPKTYDKYRDVDIMFLRKDACVVELVSPRTEHSVVSGLMKKYKNSPYHICYESDDFEEAMCYLEENGFRRFDEPCPAPALGDRRVCFLLSAAAGMIELLESKG